MNGRRVQPDEFGWVSFKLEPGDYVRVAPVKNADGSELTEDQRAQWWNKPYWMACSPNGHVGNLVNHQVTEHEDGTITVSPSIRIYLPKTEERPEKELWHGYLERGVWRSC